MTDAPHIETPDDLATFVASLPQRYEPAVAIASLHPFPGNPKEHDIGAIVSSIERNGMSDVVRAQSSTRRILGGHGTCEALTAMQWTHVPVLWIDCDDRTARRLVVAYNRIPQLGGENDEAMAAFLTPLAEADDLLGTGYDGDDFDALQLDVFGGSKKERDDELPLPELPRNPITRAGDVLCMGDHRVICGDCREPATLAALCGGRKMNVIFTSPPYASQRKYDESSGFRPIAPRAYGEWYEAVARNITAHLAGDGSYFLNIKEHCDGGQRDLYVLDLVAAHVRVWGWLWVDTFCWRDTRNGVPGGWRNRFKDAWEPVHHFAKGTGIKFRPDANATESSGVFGYSADNAHSTSGSGLLGTSRAEGYTKGRARPSNVIEIPAGGTGEHSAQFPIALPAWFVRAFSDAGDAVLDPFMGGGSTLIACEREGRVAYGVEISPAYCDVIAARWERETGKTATRSHSQ